MTMKRNPIPTGYRILIKLKKTVNEDTSKLKDEAERLKKLGMYVPEEFQKKSKQAVERLENSSAEAYVIRMGEQAFHDRPNPWCKVGDLIQVKQYEAIDIADVEDGEVYQFVNDVHVIGVLEGEELK